MRSNSKKCYKKPQTIVKDLQSQDGSRASKDEIVMLARCFHKMHKKKTNTIVGFGCGQLGHMMKGRQSLKKKAENKKFNGKSK